MQDSWKHLKSDTTSWQNILTSSFDLQRQWRVVSILYHEMKNHLTRKVGFEETPKLDPCWKSQPVTCKVNMEWESELNLLTKTILTRWVRISHGLNRLVTDLIDREYDDDEQETSTSKTEVFAFASRFKAKAKPTRPSTACSSSRTVPILERIWIDVEPGAQFDQAYPVAKRKNTLLRQWELPREEDGAIEFWRLEDDLQKNLSTLNIGLMMYGRARWQEPEARRKYFNSVLICQDKKFFTSELFKVIHDAIPLILHCRTMCYSEQFLRVCSLCTLHHKFRINSGRPKF